MNTLICCRRPRAWCVLQRKRPYASYFSNGHADAPPGVAGVPELLHPSDFSKLASVAVAHCERLRGLVGEAEMNLQKIDSRLLQQLDGISSSVCGVIDAAEFVRSTNASERWREAAEDTFSYCAAYIQELNADTRLHGALVRLINESEATQSLSSTQRRFAILLKQEFERDGIHLSADEQASIGMLHSEINQLETLYNAHSTSPPARVVLRRSGGGSTEVMLDASSAEGILSSSPDPILRQHVWELLNANSTSNVDVLDRLIEARRKLAVKLGYRSHAEKATVDKMAGTPTAVMEMLYKMKNGIAHKAKGEIELLKKAKVEVEGPHSLPIQPWDLSYYISLVRNKHFAKENGAALSMRAFLSLDNCVRGLGILCQKLFGIQMRVLDIPPSENWTVHMGQGSKNNSGLIKLELSHSAHGPLGTVFLDLIARPGKVTQAAHFTIRCGSLVNHELPLSPSYSRSWDGQYQLPIVVIVGSFSPHNLSHAEFETLLHEWGHALHSILSRTESQHLSGTRCPTDYVEMPSHLLEHFAREKDFLKLFTCHHTTRTPLPDSYLQSVIRGRHLFSGIEAQMQILYSMVDQRVFGESSSSSSDIVRDCHEELDFEALPFVDGEAWHGRFGHFTRYGGQYYVYISAKLLAEEVWARNFAEDRKSDRYITLCRRAGEILWRGALVHGGEKDPRDICQALTKVN